MVGGRIYLALIIVGALCAVSGILMRFSGNPVLRDPGTVIGWVGIGILLIARILFGRRKAKPSAQK